MNRKYLKASSPITGHSFQACLPSENRERKGQIQRIPRCRAHPRDAYAGRSRPDAGPGAFAGGASCSSSGSGRAPTHTGGHTTCPTRLHGEARAGHSAYLRPWSSIYRRRQELQLGRLGGARDAPPPHCPNKRGTSTNQEQQIDSRSCAKQRGSNTPPAAALLIVLSSLQGKERTGTLPGYSKPREPVFQALGGILPHACKQHAEKGRSSSEAGGTALDSRFRSIASGFATTSTDRSRPRNA